MKMKNMDNILSAFIEVDNRNLRIIIAWLDMFRGIFVMTNRNMKSSQHYENIISDFLRYSIWAVVSNRKNKKIIKSAYYGNSDYVYFEGHEYTHTIRYYFIDKYIRSDYLDEADLVSSARSIEARCEREKMYNNQCIKSCNLYSSLSVQTFSLFSFIYLYKIPANVSIPNLDTDISELFIKSSAICTPNILLIMTE